MTVTYTCYRFLFTIDDVLLKTATYVVVIALHCSGAGTAQWWSFGLLMRRLHV